MTEIAAGNLSTDARTADTFDLTGTVGFHIRVHQAKGHQPGYADSVGLTLRGANSTEPSYRRWHARLTADDQRIGEKARADSEGSQLMDAAAMAAPESSPDDASTIDEETDAGLGLSTVTNTILTGLSVDEAQLLAIPLSTVVRELRTYAAFIHARTFGDVRPDADAGELVADYEDTYIERLLEDGQIREPENDQEAAALLAEHTGNGAPFDALLYFGEEEFMVWHPDPRLSTSRWLDANEPDLFAIYRRADTASGIVYEPTPFIHPDDRAGFEAALRDRAYNVIQTPGLADLYLNDPEPDPFPAIAAAAGLRTEQ